MHRSYTIAGRPEKGRSLLVPTFFQTINELSVLMMSISVILAYVRSTTDLAVRLEAISLREGD